MAFLQFCWLVTALASCVAAVGLVFGFATANGAPQEAAIAAGAAAVAIIPYVFTRCVEGIVRGYPVRVWVDNAASGDGAEPASLTPKPAAKESQP